MKRFFTLIELITTIVVIGILAAIVLLNISDIQTQASETARAANERELQMAVDRYHIDNGLYPTTIQPTLNNPQLLEYDKVIPTYIKKKPKQDYLVWVDDKGNVTVEFGKGEEKPFVPISCEEAQADGFICITTPQEFNDMRNNLSGKYILMNDIDLASFNSFQPIGTEATGFKGVLDGNGYKVLNLTILDNEIDSTVNRAHGIFGFVNYGTFRNIAIENVNIETFDNATSPSYSYVGALIGRIYSDSIVNPSNQDVIIQNVSVQGDILTKGPATSFSNNTTGVASLAGYIYSENANISIDNNSFSGKITSTGSKFGLSSGLLGNIVLSKTSINSAPLKLTITNSSVNNLELDAPNAVGFVSGIFVLDGNSEVHVNKNSVSGTLKGTATVYGFSNFIRSMNSKTQVTIENIDTNTTLLTTGDTLFGSAESSGLFGAVDFSNRGPDTYDSVLHDSSLNISNISVSGNISAENTNGYIDRGTLGGLMNQLSYDTVVINSVIKDVHVSSNIKNLTSEMINVSGFVSNYTTDSATVTENIESITISGDLKGTDSAGFIEDYASKYGTLTSVIENIKISGTIESEYSSSAFINNYLLEEKAATTTIRDVQVNSTLIGGSVSGFVNQLYNEAESSSSSVLVDKYSFEGKMIAQSEVAGMILYLDNDMTSGNLFTFQNIFIGGEVELTDLNPYCYGGLICGYSEYPPANNYVFKNVLVASNSTVSNVDYQGMIADTYSVPENITFENVYFDSATTGFVDTTNTMGTSKTTSELRQQDTYVNWDFTNIWTITEGVSYPKLK